MYIKDLSCISPQKTYDDSFLNGEVTLHQGNRYIAQESSYGTLIPGGLLRRMGKAVRMGIGAGLPLINDSKELAGIILSTCNGGLEDCLKFLNQIVEYDEGTLTPTNFVQSTPNSVAGNLALMSKTTSYNNTHVHKGLAFECALLDAFLLFEEQKVSSILLGGVDEISDYNYNIDVLNHYFKKEETTSENLLSSGTPGTVCGEGSTMFLVEREKTTDSLAQIVDVDQVTFPKGAQLNNTILDFLKRNKLKPQNIDTLILGLSGDSRYDFIYQKVQSEIFPESQSYCFKNLVGDYPTASSFGVWMGTQILQGKKLASQIVKESDNVVKPCNVLIYNHYQGVQHGLILMRAI